MLDVSLGQFKIVLCIYYQALQRAFFLSQIENTLEDPYLKNTFSTLNCFLLNTAELLPTAMASQEK